MTTVLYQRFKNVSFGNQSTNDGRTTYDIIDQDGLICTVTMPSNSPFPVSSNEPIVFTELLIPLDLSKDCILNWGNLVQS